MCLDGQFQITCIRTEFIHLKVKNANDELGSPPLPTNDMSLND